MKKIILSFLMTAVLGFSAFAQQHDQKIKVSIGAEYLHPFGDFTEYYSMGYGASLQGEYKVSPQLSATLSGGYTILAINKLYKGIYSPWGVDLKNSVFYPVKAGLKYDLHKHIYAAAEAGASISKDQNMRATSFAYAGGLGTKFEISSKSSIDLGLRYEAWSLNSNNTYSFVGIRAAYVFGFK